MRRANSTTWDALQFYVGCTIATTGAWSEWGWTGGLLVLGLFLGLDVVGGNRDRG